MNTSPSSGLAIKLHGIAKLFLVEVSVRWRHLEYLVVPDVPGGMWAVSGALELIILLRQPSNALAVLWFKMCFCEVPREALNLNLMTTGLWRRRTQIASAEDSEDLVTSCDTSCLVAEAWNAVKVTEVTEHRGNIKSKMDAAVLRLHMSH